MPARPSPPGLPVTVWITADQCSPRNSALAASDPAETVVLMIESVGRANLKPYHQRKLAFVYSVMRHYADDLRAAGWRVDYRAEQPDFAAAFDAHVAAERPALLRMERQTEHGFDERFAALAARHDLPVAFTPHANFISTADDYRAVLGDAARVTMETFYRRMRRTTGLLMDGDQPAGGAWNFDAANRRPPPRGGLRFAPPPVFAPDPTTREAIAMVGRHFADHPGIIGDFHLAVTRRDALRALDDFVEHRLDTFGPWQDAMLRGERAMSHSLLSAYLNVGLLHPLEVAERAELAYRSGAARLQSVEGFIRQVIGWREFVWQTYRHHGPSYRERNALGADIPVPAFYWDGKTEMACLRDALGAVRETAYAHHIQRLMLLGNFALVAGLDPQATNDWFWAMFVDGYEWVMVPNVIGMSLHADGGIVGTKPYAAAAAYVDRMSDYCRGCRYDPKALDGDDACPFNALYWDFLARNEVRFAKNHRMALAIRGWRAKPDGWKARVRTRASALRARLRAGGRL